MRERRGRIGGGCGNRPTKDVMNRPVELVLLLVGFTFLLSCTSVGFRVPYDCQPIKDNTLVEMPDFFIKAPSGEGWGVYIAKDLSRIMFVREYVRYSYFPYQNLRMLIETRIYVDKNKVPEEKWHLTEQEFANEFVQELEPYGRKKVNKGQTTIDGKILFVVTYREAIIHYVYCPTNFHKNHIFYTFSMQTSMRSYEKDKAPKSSKVDLDQILPVIKSFKLKTDTQ